MVSILSPLSLMAVTFTAIMYVDDTDLFVVSQSRNESIASVYTRAAYLVSIWWRSIWATGGLLRPDKCRWYLIGFKWCGSKWKYITKEDDMSSIAIPNIHGNDETVKRHGVDVAEETLGVYVAVDGNISAEKVKLSDATKSWTKNSCAT